MSTTLARATFPDLGKEQCIALTTFRQWQSHRSGDRGKGSHSDGASGVYSGFDRTGKEIRLHASSHQKCLAPAALEGES